MDRHQHRHRHQQQQQHHHNTHRHDDGGAESEDGQLQSSPYGGGVERHSHRDHHHHQRQSDNNNSMDDEDTTDSLDIKPPQAAGTGHQYNHHHQQQQQRYREKVKKSTSSTSVVRDADRRKHSKEHRHKADAAGGGPADQYHQQHHHHHRAPSSADGADQQQHHSRTVSVGSGRSRDAEREQHRTSGGSGGVRRENHNARDVRDGRGDRHHRQQAPSQQPSEADRALEDLRSRLLSKRIKFDAERRAATEHGVGHPEGDYRSDDHHHNHHNHQQQQQHRDIYRYEDEQPFSSSSSSNKRDRHSAGNAERTSGQRHRGTEVGGAGNNKRNVIDLVDSPEPYYNSQQAPTPFDRYNHRRASDTSSNGKHTQINDASMFADDPELMARRAKLLDADREKERRRDVAREELEARRVQRRRDLDLKDDNDDEDMMASKRRSGKSKRAKGSVLRGAGGAVSTIGGGDERRSEESVVHVSDDDEVRGPTNNAHSDGGSASDEEDSSTGSSNSDEDDDDDVNDDEVDNDTDREDAGGKARPNPNIGKDESDESDGELPVTPPSVGELSKSERRQQRANSHDESRTHSRSRSASASRSRSAESRSKSPRSRSHSRSRSRSRSHSRSARRRSRSRNSSRSTRSRSHSRSPTAPSSGANLLLLGKRSHSPGSDYERDHQRTSKKLVSNHATAAAARARTPPLSAAELAAEESAARAALLPNYYPGVQGCRSVEEFQCLNRIEEGTYGVVYRARDKRTEEIVALKRLKMEKEKEGFPITSLREINTLLKGQHPNIVTVREIVVGSNMDKIFIVMDYVEHDLKSLMETMRHRKQSFLPGEVKCLTQQLLRAVGHLHDNWILHRDLKTSNLLLSHKGILKVGDFGLAREYGSPLKPYTSVVVTLWYRAPELLLCCKEYSHPIDMWSVGCIFAEFLAMGALFPGKSEVDQLSRIFKDLGTPNEKIWPGYSELPAVQKMTFTEYPVSHLRKKFAHLTSEQGLQLMQGLLTYDPKQRFSAEHGLRSAYFRELPLPIDPAMFPTWPAKSELGARKALASSPKPPSGGGQFKQLQAGDAVEMAASGVAAEAAESRGFVLNAGMGGGGDGRLTQQGGGFSLRF